MGASWNTKNVLYAKRGWELLRVGSHADCKTVSLFLEILCATRELIFTLVPDPFRARFSPTLALKYGLFCSLALMRVFFNSHRLSSSRAKRLSRKIRAGSNSMRVDESAWKFQAKREWEFELSTTPILVWHGFWNSKTFQGLLHNLLNFSMT